jgi:hypothetical protein
MLINRQRHRAGSSLRIAGYGMAAYDIPAQLPKRGISDMKKPPEAIDKSVQLIKARFHIHYKKSSGTVRFSWSDRSVTEREVSSVAEYLAFLSQIHAAGLQKPDGM